MKAKKKQPSLPTLKNKLDILFSKYIRLRDANGTEYATCVSCGKIGLWQEMDCGHFVSRRHLATRWDEFNAHAQCRHCNRFRPDQYIDYTRWMLDKYGMAIVDELTNKKHEPYKVTRMDLQQMIDDYATKLARLAMGQVNESEGRKFWREHVS